MGVSFILDTGASKTVIDNDAFSRLGFDLKHLKDGDRLMTASGVISSKILKLPNFRTPDLAQIKMSRF